MAILDIFKRNNTKSNESNTLFGQTALGNNVLWAAGQKGTSTAQQVLYVTTASTTNAGRPVDMSVLSRNSTIMSCVGVKARALGQLPIKVVYQDDNGTFVDALRSDSVGPRDKAKAKQVTSLLANPNNFQSQYEFWYQWLMWHELSGEAFTLWWRKDQDNSTQTPLEMYVMDSTLIAATVTPTRYPTYRISTPMGQNDYFGFANGNTMPYYQIMHVKDQAWQGSAGFNKGILASELVGLDQDIDLYANYIMQNGAKPSGLFKTAAVIPDGKYKEIASRLKEAWNQMTGSKDSDQSKAGQGMLLDQGMTYEPIQMLNLQDADAAALKLQTMKRICGVFGVPPAMVGLSDQKYNNTQTMLDEFYKSTMYPLLVNVQQKLKQHLFAGYPNLYVEFDTRNFLKGAPLDQMNFANAGVSGGIMTPNEAREYLGMGHVEGADELLNKADKVEPIPGSSPQDTGGGGGNQTRKLNIGKK